MVKAPKTGLQKNEILRGNVQRAVPEQRQMALQQPARCEAPPAEQAVGA